MAYRVVLKQIAPRVLNSIRLNLKAVMLFLFAGEMIASTDGLAYRIALLRRHMGMDVIIPYVLWVALLLFLVDFGMRLIIARCIPGFGRPDDRHRERVGFVRITPRPVLDGIHLHIAEGEFVCVLGQTGCGKSTLLRLMLGSEKPVNGRVLMDGREHHQPDRTRGYVPQKYSLFPDKTVLDNITFGPEVAEFSLLGRLTPRFYRRRRDSAPGLRLPPAHRPARGGRPQISRPAFGRHAAARRDRAGPS